MPTLFIFPHLTPYSLPLTTSFHPQSVQIILRKGESYQKGDKSPVTVADYGAQALVVWSLKRSFPGAPFSLVGEEDSDDLLSSPQGLEMLDKVTHFVNETLAASYPGTTPLTTDDVVDLIDYGVSDGGPVGRYWVLDPIDGTRGFVGMRQYAVCLGLLDDGEVVVGALGAPNLPQWSISEVDCAEGQSGRSFVEDGVGSMFAAEIGKGTYTGPLFESGLPMQRVFCNDTVPPAKVRYMESFEVKHSNHKLSLAVAGKIGIELPSLKLDSQAKYGALARGDASIFMRFPPASYREKIWDHAAGAIVITEAGACITDTEGNPLDFSQGRFFPPLNGKNGGVIAATPSMHKAIMQALSELPDEMKMFDGSMH
jgi:3'(2'), 5'-bisphosphate nucleotidase/inositol polyphosphate 1-phosphatase